MGSRRQRAARQLGSNASLSTAWATIRMQAMGPRKPLPPQSWASLPVARGRPVHQLHGDLPRQLSPLPACLGQRCPRCTLSPAAGAPFGPPGLWREPSPGAGEGTLGDTAGCLAPYPTALHKKLEKSACCSGRYCLRNASTSRAKASRNLSHPSRGQGRASAKMPKGMSPTVPREDDAPGCWSPASRPAEGRAVLAAAAILPPYSSLPTNRA